MDYLVICRWCLPVVVVLVECEEQQDGLRTVGRADRHGNGYRGNAKVTGLDDEAAGMAVS